MQFLQRLGLRRRTTTPRIEGEVEFLGEQDGPPERELKAALVAEFAHLPVVRVAYLARVRYPAAPGPDVALCLETAPERDERAIVGQVQARFATLFGSAAYLDIMFLTQHQVLGLAQVCPAFYRAA